MNNTPMLKQKDQARWDTKNCDIFLQVCLDEVGKGNRRGMSFNNEGRRNCVTNFCKLSGREYDWGQLKNHWDNLKTDWILWNSFTKEGMTGIGWNSEKGTFEASEEWWNLKIERFPKAKKFRVKGLDHIHELDILFKSISATGSITWAPTSGVLPNFSQSDNPDDVENVENERDDSNSEDIGDVGRKRVRETHSSSSSKRQKKGTVSAKISKDIGQLCKTLRDRATKGPVQMTLDNPGCSTADVMKLLRSIPGCEPRSQLFFLGTRLFKDKENRDMFVALEDQETRLQWLKEQ